MAEYQAILYAAQHGVATITLNRPEVLNASGDRMMAEILEALQQAEHDDAVRVVVITGAGRAFCAGQDLKEVDGSAAGLSELLRRRYNPVILKIRDLPKPVIAAINGVAAGAGLSLALACDLRLASDKARLIEAFARIALVPDAGSTFFLPRLVGLARASELAFLGDEVSAAEAERLGLVNRVVPADDLAAATRALAQRLAAAPTRAIGLIKRALNHALEDGLEATLDYEASLQEIAAQGEDFPEGLAAFREKRPARFHGR